MGSVDRFGDTIEHRRIPFGELPAFIEELQINEDFWGTGSTDQIKSWLRENYDPGNMPPLSVASIERREGVWLLGWKHNQYTERSLLSTIFGEHYAEQNLARSKAIEEIAVRLTDEDRGQFGLANDKEAP